MKAPTQIIIFQFSIFATVFFTFHLPFANAQSPITYDTHIQPIITQNCVPCHKVGGIGPFSLESYEDVAKRAEFIAKVTENRYMPPFPADKSFQHYANERGLKDEEIELIQKWIQSPKSIISPPPSRRGSQRSEVKKSKVQKLPLRGGRGAFFSFKMQQPFVIPNTNEEEFRYFHVPTNLKKDIFVEAIEFLPGNRKILHHSRVMVDTSGRMSKIEGLKADDHELSEFQKIPMSDQFLYGWVPGNDVIRFPKGIAKRVKANANLVMNLHYSPSSKIQTDQSRINFYTSKTKVEREVKSLLLTEENITNQPFLIKANTKPTFYMNYGPIKEDMSAISILPHMHWLGKSIKAFAITPEGDLIPFVKIDNWDFNWQMTYQFKTLLFIPKGSVVLVEATFDNTSANELNPSYPPKDVTYGWASTSEMLEMVIYYVPYRKGDELVKQ